MTNNSKKNGKPTSRARNLIADRIKSKMDELLKEVRDRRRLEKECLDSLRDESRASFMELDDLMRWTLGADPVIEQRRLDLENRLSKVRKETRDQKVALWKDVQALRKEIRDLRDVYEAVREAERAAANGNGSAKPAPK